MFINLTDLSVQNFCAENVHSHIAVILVYIRTQIIDTQSCFHARIMTRIICAQFVMRVLVL